MELRGPPNVGHSDVRRHDLLSAFHCLNLNSLLAVTMRSSKSPPSKGCHMQEVGIAVCSIRIGSFRSTTPFSKEDFSRSYSTKYRSSATETRARRPSSRVANWRPVMVEVWELNRPRYSHEVGGMEVAELLSSSSSSSSGDSRAGAAPIPVGLKLYNAT